MRYLQLWCTELPPVLDVTVGPINGAAPLGAERSSEGTGSPESRTGKPVPEVAAPPEPTPADSEGAADTTTASQEAPGTEREGGAWVPWSGGECPVPGLTEVYVSMDGLTGISHPAGELYWEKGGGITAYRLTNPRRRDVPPLPVVHPHYAMQRLWRSDDTLRAWWLNPAYSKWVEAIAPFVWASNVRYHVGHVAPQEAG